MVVLEERSFSRMHPLGMLKTSTKFYDYVGRLLKYFILTG